MLLTWSSSGGTSGEPELRMPSGHFTGDAGRLAKWSTAGVMGVLDGRGPSSMGRTGKDLEPILGKPSTAWWVLGGR